VRILAKFIFVSHIGRVVVGALDQFKISLFLDLFSACTYPAYRRRIAKLLVRQINNAPSQERPSHIAVPKEGNVLLAAEVARQMRLSVVVVRTIVPAIRFGDPIEGMVSAGACVIVVDDIAADGELLVRTVAVLRSHGARVFNCFCAVERLDGNSRERLAKHDVTLHAPIKIDEPTLRELAHLRAEERQEHELSPNETTDD
jgi:orotate phosphoribosyltransferase